MSEEILPVIHIGMPKTATKTLQWRLFAGHEEIFYLGRYDGGIFKGKYREFEACRDETVFQVMEQVAYHRIHNPDMEFCRKTITEYLREPLAQGLVPVWSWESYSTDSRRNRQARADNLKELFGKARILVGIRHPVKLLKSAYMQQLKRDNIGGRYSRLRGGFYRDINDWVMKDSHRDITNHLEYAKTVRMYVEAFGVENVCVVPFELLVADSRAFYQRVCEFVGVDLEKALSLLGENVDNSRWTTEQLEILQRIRGSWIKRLQFQLADRRERKKILDLDQGGNPSNPGAGASPEISVAVKQHIVDQASEGNEWLDEVFNLDLRSYGYFEP